MNERQGERPSLEDNEVGPGRNSPLYTTRECYGPLFLPKVPTELTVTTREKSKR